MISQLLNNFPLLASLRRKRPPPDVNHHDCRSTADDSNGNFSLAVNGSWFDTQSKGSVGSSSPPTRKEGDIRETFIIPNHLLKEPFRIGGYEEETSAAETETFVIPEFALKQPETFVLPQSVLKHPQHPNENNYNNDGVDDFSSGDESIDDGEWHHDESEYSDDDYDDDYDYDYDKQPPKKKRKQMPYQVNEIVDVELSKILPSLDSNRLGYNANKAAYDKIMQLPAIQALPPSHYNEMLPEQRRQYWKGRVSGVLGKGANTKGSAARLADSNKEGLHMIFGESTYQQLIDISSMQRGEDVPGKYGGWTADASSPIAYKKTLRKLKQLTRHTKKSVKDLLGGYSLKEFIKRYNSKEGLKKLERLTKQNARNKAEALQLDEDAIKEDEEILYESFVRRGSNLMWLNAVNVLVYYNGIIKGLVTKKFGCFPCERDEYLLLGPVPCKINTQFCIGQLVRIEHLDVCDYEQIVMLEQSRESSQNSSYVAEYYYSSDRPIVIDMDAKLSTLGSDNEDSDDDIDEEESNGAEYRAIPVPGTLHQNARMISICRHKNAPLTTFRLRTRRHASDTIHKRPKLWPLHVWEQVLLENAGLGFHQDTLVREYLNLKDGEHFEQLEQFQYSTDDEQYQERRAKHLEKKGWTDVNTAPLSDRDHTVGRSEVWMNGTMYTISCSHCWNQCMSQVRIAFRDWCFAFVDKPYGNGND